MFHNIVSIHVFLYYAYCSIILNYKHLCLQFWCLAVNPCCEGSHGFGPRDRCTYTGPSDHFYFKRVIPSSCSIHLLILLDMSFVCTEDSAACDTYSSSLNCVIINIKSFLASTAAVLQFLYYVFVFFLLCSTRTAVYYLFSLRTIKDREKRIGNSIAIIHQNTSVRQICIIKLSTFLLDNSFPDQTYNKIRRKGLIALYTNCLLVIDPQLIVGNFPCKKTPTPAFNLRQLIHQVTSGG